MSKVMITESYLEDIADAIRTKNGSSDTYKPAEMADAITSIPGGGITPTGTKQISITSNGTTTENVEDYASAEIAVAVSPNVGTKSITANGTYNASSDNLDGYSSVSVNVSSHPGFALIGTYTVALTEYTNTSTWETTDTQINVKNTDYAYILVVVTCDSAITTSTEWGMSLHLGGRYTSNGNLLGGATMQQKGTATLSYASMTSGTMKQDSYGVIVQGNTANIQISRKAHASGCPKIRAGNYTVSVYGMSSL